jgi:hypothetical protein
MKGFSVRCDRANVASVEHTADAEASPVQARDSPYAEVLRHFNGAIPEGPAGARAPGRA